MKKIYLYLTSIIILFSFVLISCDSNTSTTRPVLTDEQIKENFSTEIANTSFSKENINSFINEGLRKNIDNPLVSELENLELDNTRANIEVTDVNDQTKNSTAYLWQKDDVVYIGTLDDESTVYKFDTSTYKEIIKAFKEEVNNNNEIDYVALIGALLNIPSDYSIDTILASLKFTSDDFTYVDGYFVLNESSLIRALATATKYPQALLSAFYYKYIYKTEIKLGYNGYEFTSFVIEIHPNNDEFDSSKSYFSYTLNLTYENSDVVSSEINLIIKAYSKDGNSSYSLEFVEINKKTLVSGGLIININDNSEVSLNLNFEIKENEINITLNGTYKDSNTDTITYSGKLNITNTNISGSLKANDITIIEISGLITEDNATITIDFSPYEGIYDFKLKKVVLNLDYNNVTIPDTLIAKESEAIDILSK